MSWDIFPKSKIQYFLQKLKDKFVQKETGKGLSTNDYTTTDKNKVSKIDTATTSISGNPISISGLKANQLAANPIITFEPIQAGSGTPSPSNIRAISGYDKVEALSCGINVWDETWELGGIVWNTGQEIAATDRIRTGFVPVISEGTYYLYVLSSIIGLGYGVVFYNKSKERISSNSGIAANSTFTTPANTAYIRLVYIGITSYTSGISVNYPSTVHDYIPYNKSTSISESLGQTVYWLTHTVRTGIAKILGQLLVNPQNLDWHEGSRNVFYAALTSGVGNGWSSHYAFSNLPYQTMDDLTWYTNNNYIYIRNTNYGGNISGFAASLNGVQFVYPLATPTEIQLTPHEISLLKDYAYVSTNGTSIALDYHNGELASLSDVAQVGETVNELGDEVSGISATVNELTQKIITKAVGGEGWIVPLKMGMLIFYGRNNNSKKGMGIVDQTNTFAPIVALDGCTVTVSTVNNTVTLVGNTAGEFTVIYP